MKSRITHCNRDSKSWTILIPKLLSTSRTHSWKIPWRIRRRSEEFRGRIQRRWHAHTIFGVLDDNIQPFHCLLPTISLRLPHTKMPLKASKESPSTVAESLTSSASTSSPAFLVVYASVVDGKMWCGDCRVAEPLVEKYLGSRSEEVKVIYAGNRAEYVLPAFSGDLWRLLMLASDGDRWRMFGGRNRFPLRNCLRLLKSQLLV